MSLERIEGARTSLSIYWGRRSALVDLSIKFAWQNPLGGIGAVIAVALILVAIIAPFVTPFDPDEIFLEHEYSSPGERGPEGQRYILGSDQLGRDILSRLLMGARISIYVGLVSVAIGVTAGALIGIVSAYVGGTLDLIVQRFVDALMAFPGLILGLGIMAVLGASLQNVIVVLVVLFIPGSSRVLRSTALSVKETVYIEAARTIGCSELRIILRHVLPNCLAPYIVFATANLGVAIVVEASLSFLGVGTPIDVPSWGGMLSVAGTKYVEVAPWLLIFPSMCIFVVVFGFNLLGDAIRDVLDPRLRGAI